ncbi:laminin domain protein [Ceratobasidium sp. AG-Ba]|nr:laminin domain protein [Ceratobasidium sp. AG-Ba]QRW11710.1 laminin domain protein [Ceratobasidium sp. AG-Ba]
MKLSQHLFNLQIARYRDRYPDIKDTIYTPPVLPAHIPVSLEQVTGNPSDEQVKSVQTALRFSESFVSIPSVFDADLSMNLSQHLFDLQFERYLRQVLGIDPAPAQVLPSEHPVPAHSSDVAPNIPLEISDDDESLTLPVTSDTPILHSATSASNETHLDLDTNTERATNQTEDSLNSIQLDRELITNHEDTNHVLLDIKMLLGDIKQFMVRSYNLTAKALNGTYHTAKVNICHSLINEKGEDPELAGLPSVATLSWPLERREASQVDSTVLARYLHLYGLADGFFEGGDPSTFREDKKYAAMEKLRIFLRGF